jgi:hypothetical protein
MMTKFFDGTRVQVRLIAISLKSVNVCVEQLDPATFADARGR